MKYCVIDSEKICDNCGDCERCELDPNKICDNCCKCLEISDVEEDYKVFPLKELEGLSHDAEEGQTSLLWEDEDDLDEMDDEMEDDLEFPEIDPRMMAEWEQKLSQYERDLESAQALHMERTEGNRKEPRYGVRQRKK